MSACLERPTGGVYAALITPRRHNSVEADTGALLDYLDSVMQTGVAGLVLFGSTGEFVHFDIEERMRAAALAIKRSRVPVLVNVSHSSLPGALVLAETAVNSGAAGLLLMPPYFYRYPDDQICEFYFQFVKLLDDKIPVYLYNLPAFTNGLSRHSLERLLSSGSFAGIKESAGDWQLFEHLERLRATHRFELFVGNDAIYRRALEREVSGIISGVAAALPELLIALDRAARAGDSARAARLNDRLSEFLAYVEKFPATVAIRQAAAVRGWTTTDGAVPLDEDMAAEVIAFHAWFREWLPGVLVESREVIPAPAA